MNVIEKLGLKKCKGIVDGASNESGYYCTNVEVYHLCDDLLSHECCINLFDLRTALADHKRTDHCTDIKNHISPNTKVSER